MTFAEYLSKQHSCEAREAEEAIRAAQLLTNHLPAIHRWAKTRADAASQDAMAAPTDAKFAYHRGRYDTLMSLSAELGGWLSALNASYAHYETTLQQNQQEENPYGPV